MKILTRVAAVLAAAAIATPAFACGLKQTTADAKADHAPVAQAPKADEAKAQPQHDQKSAEAQPKAAEEKDRKVAQK
ncbi:MAG TPA: hypothetical protein VEB43_10560 [Anaeromyxobacter sp.]|nr:hypothetical protein [Anaeromyxobacter sp.]